MGCDLIRRVLRISSMTTVRQPAERPSRPRKSWPPYLSIVTQPNTFGANQTGEELSALVQAVATRGDRQAFAALFKHFAPRVKAYLIRLGTAEAMAEDLAQEALVSVWRKAHLFDPAHAGVSTWVFTIARNLRVDHFRRRSHQELELEEGQAERVPDTAPAPDEHCHAAQQEDEVRRAMQQLSPDQAHVLRLSFFEEHPHAQIAQDLGIPLGTVKSRVRLAMNHLRRLLGHLEP